MDESRDFVKWLGQDMPMKILAYLNDPSDLVRASAVSRSWREFGELVFLTFDLVFYFLSSIFSFYSFYIFWLLMAAMQ